MSSELLSRFIGFSIVAVELLIIGSAGLAKETAQLARQIDPNNERWDRISYVAENLSSLGREMPYGEVRYTDAQLASLERSVDVAIGIGYPHPRRRVAQRLAANPCFRFPNLVHPSVEIDAKFTTLGRGNMVCKGVVLTCDIVIGEFNLLNWNVTVGHDTRIGSFCVVNPGCNVSGNVQLGDGCLLGTGCQVLEGLMIEAESTVGAGAVVIHSIEASGTYVGVPARLVK
jgi:sugar O-acyltransferase (sialic acid O-acetyltransferase NeuD family)